MRQALGLVEAIGLATAIEAADAAVKGDDTPRTQQASSAKRGSYSYCHLP